MQLKVTLLSFCMMFANPVLADGSCIENPDTQCMFELALANLEEVSERSEATKVAVYLAARLERTDPERAREALLHYFSQLLAGRTDAPIQRPYWDSVGQGALDSSHTLASAPETAKLYLEILQNGSELGAITIDQAFNDATSNLRAIARLLGVLGERDAIAAMVASNALPSSEVDAPWSIAVEAAFGALDSRNLALANELMQDFEDLPQFYDEYRKPAVLRLAEAGSFPEAYELLKGEADPSKRTFLLLRIVDAQVWDGKAEEAVPHLRQAAATHDGSVKGLGKSIMYNLVLVGMPDDAEDFAAKWLPDEVAVKPMLDFVRGRFDEKIKWPPEAIAANANVLLSWDDQTLAAFMRKLQKSQRRAALWGLATLKAKQGQDVTALQYLDQLASENGEARLDQYDGPVFWSLLTRMGQYERAAYRISQNDDAASRARGYTDLAATLAAQD